MIRVYSHPLPAGVPSLADHYEADDLIVIIVSSSLPVTTAVAMIDDMLGRICRGIRS